MIHIATVHINNDNWISIQLKYLRKHINQNFKTWVILDGYDTETYNTLSQNYDYTYTTEGLTEMNNHAWKLDFLAQEISKQANSDDLILFIDGDAIPITNLDKLINDKLEKYNIISIRRDENAGDMQPHPCFFLTKVSLWNEIKGTWAKGPKFFDSHFEKPIPDVGGKLNQILESKNIPWYPLTRTNKNNPHYLFYGVYGNSVYHHGASFRKKGSWNDYARLLKEINAKSFDELGQCIDELLEIDKENQIVSDKIFSKIKEDDEFYKFLIE